MPKYDRDGNPLEGQDDPYPIDPATSRNALTGGVQGITDPSTKTSAPDPNSPAEIARANSIYGPGGTAFNKPSPTSTWDPKAEAWNTAAPTNTRPTGGSLSDPAYRQSFISWAASQPGVNPSVKNDPGYWDGRFASGAFGNDQDYALQRMMQAEGLPEGAGAPAPTAGPAPAAAGGAINASVGPSQPTIDYNAQIRKILLDQIAGLGAPTTADSPEVAPAISAFNNQSQRDQTTNRDALAERFYASGEGGQALNSGGFNTSVQQGLEKSAGDRANFTGSTILNVANQKRQQLQQMLQTATSAGLTDAAQQIQAKIAELDASLRQQGITNQASQFDRSLAQNNSQFGDSLGMTYAQLLAQENRDTLLAGLNG